MKDPSIIDRYVLYLIESGIDTQYEMLREVGVSLGASTPCLNRLIKGGFVSKLKRKTGKRAKFEFSITAAGKSVLRADISALLSPLNAARDMDSIIRLLEMATHYRVARKATMNFLNQVMEERQRRVGAGAARGSKRLAVVWRQLWDVKRLKADVDFLIELQGRIPNHDQRKGKVPDGMETMSFDSGDKLSQKA